MSDIISIVMPCYKAGEFIREALESIGLQTYLNWELLAVDDAGPADGSKEAVAEFSTTFPDHRIEWISHPVNRGVSAARNTAILNSVGKYLALLDPDDYWLPNHLKKSIEVLESDPDVAVFTSPSYIFRESPLVHNDEIEFFDELERGIFPYCFAFRNGLPTSACVIRRLVVDQIGLFDEDMETAEDYDLWLRIVSSGYRFALSQEPCACYRKRSGGFTSDQKRMRSSVQKLANKHMAFLFSLQKVALEMILNESKNTARRLHRLENMMELQHSRIQQLEEVNQRIRETPLFSYLLRLRRRLLGMPEIPGGKS